MTDDFKTAIEQAGYEYSENGFRKAITSDDAEIIPKFLNAGFNPEQTDRTGYTALMNAVTENALNSVVCLLENKVQVNRVNRYGKSALMMAVINGNTQIAQALLEFGANINQQSSTGETPLMLAIIANNLDMVKLLLRHNADTNIVSKDEFTAMSLARKTGNKYIEESIEFYKDQKTAEATEKTSAIEDESKLFDSDEFYSAIEKGDSETVKRLLSEGQNPDPVTSNYTPVMLAAREGQPEALREILKHNPRLNRINKNGYTALHIAVISGNTTCVELLVEHGIDINIKSKGEDTALHKAILQQNPEMVELLLKKGANPNIDNGRSYRPIDLAILKEDEQIVKMLLSHGAQPSDGDTFEDLTSRAANSNIAELIKQYA